MWSISTRFISSFGTKLRAMPALGYVCAAAAMATVIAFVLLFSRVLIIPNAGVLYLLVVIASAFWLGTGPAVVALVLAFFAIAYFYATLDESPAVTIVRLVVILTALVVGVVLARLARREQARALASAGEARLQATEAERNRAQFEAVFQAIGDGVVLFDLAGNALLVNEAAARISGFESAEDMKRNLAYFGEVYEIAYPDGQPVPFDQWPAFRALRGESFANWVLRGRRRGTGQAWFFSFSGAPVRDEQGRQILAVVITRDITELVALDKLKDSFISVAAHELKTPVTIMKGYAQALLRPAEGASERQRKMLEAIDRGSHRIDGIVMDLLDISKLHAGRLELTPEPVDLPALVAETADRIALTATKHRIRLPSAEPVVVHVDRDRIEQVLVNLIDNAIKYSPAGGDVDLTVSVRGREAVVSVRDYGVGIPKERQDRIFQRFYRAHDGTPYDYGGMGVGLYISKEIVGRHGGRTWFESEEGKGSIFYFSLPIG